MNPAQAGAPAFAADKPIVSVKALATNTRVLNFVRSVMFVYAGSVAGVLGLTGLQGFAFYVTVFVVVSVAMLMFMKSSGKAGDAKSHDGDGLQRFFLTSSPVSFALSGMGGQLVTYILFWTLAYALVHLY